MLNWNLHSFKLLEIIQVLDSISWVRCASGNVSSIGAHQNISCRNPVHFGELSICEQQKVFNFNIHTDPI